MRAFVRLITSLAIALALPCTWCAPCAADDIELEHVKPEAVRSVLKQPRRVRAAAFAEGAAAENIEPPPPEENVPFDAVEGGPLGIYEDGGCGEGDPCANEGYFPFGFHFRHAGRGEPGRHIGLGEPLEGTSWLNRPWHADWFVGGMFADELIPGRVDQRDGFFGGIRLGCDFDHYWGWEVRWQDPTFDLVETGVTAPRAGYNYFLDVELLYYPWGDARWRPYTTVGLGFTGFRFIDDTNRQIDQALLNIPIGVGLKYLMGKNCVLRFDLVNNIAIGSAELQTMNNFQFTGGMEYRFGGTRTSYYPWNPSIHLW